MDTILFEGLNAFKQPFIIISFDKQNNWLIAEWSGIQTVKTIMEGGEMILKYLKETKSTKVLNDNRKVVGTWTPASEWTTEVWMPQMLEAGLKHFAWIKSKDVFSKFSIDKVSNKSDKSIVRITNTLEDAVEWLKYVDEPIAA